MSGMSHLCFCSSLPYFTRRVWLPEFGATTPNNDAAPICVSKYFVHVGQLEKVEACAAVLDRQVWSPQARLLHDVLDVFAPAACFLEIVRREARVHLPRPQQVLVREDLLIDDLRRQCPHVVDPFGSPGNGLHIHQHGHSTRPYGSTMNVVTMPNMPLGPSAWVRM